MSIIACSVNGCEKQAWSRGWCGMHYARWRANGTVELPEKPKECRVKACRSRLKAGQGKGFCNAHYRRYRRIFVLPECSVNECERISQTKGLCGTHYSRLLRKGDPNHRLQGEVVDGKRICPRCGVDKPLDEYTYASSIPCKPCSAALTAEYRKHNPYQPVDRTEKICACGKMFMADKRRSRYCSADCKANFKNRDNWPHMNKRRASIRKAFVEKFDRLEIFERDGWQCKLCGYDIDPSVKFPHKRSATLDHIIPISKGGKHERSNAQTACHACNSAKGNRMTP